ncbi:MAG: bifunctional 5,10-methylenetetrahydrofolate dehydrogenase/5,10-methenyltetrahydrofolate cyclohydrolase [bacterium]|nr:bifunctional 5,10-methylenetetrahydrofolate dehydrogenase/5,10-methenyltetrahydrofolate cyclohydrolase [bacterium]
MLIDGRTIAAEVVAELKAKKRDFAGKKMLGILVGDNAASLSFLRQKQQTASELGVQFEVVQIAAPITEAELITRIKKLTADAAVTGAIVQLPIAGESIDTPRVLDAVPYEKDVDCLGDRRSREYYANPLTAAIAPPAVGTVKTILRRLGITDVKGKSVVVYGYGRLVGKPVAAWGVASGAIVTILRRNSTREEIASALGNSDIIVTGVGQKNLISVADVRPGTIVVDFGYPADIDAVAAHGRGILVTPTPGGTGPVLVAELFRNLYAI